MEKDKLLFTPGPLTTSRNVKAAGLHDLGSRDTSFIELVGEVREQLLELAGVSKEAGYEAVIIQGSGTYGLESVLSSVLSDDDHLIILINGVYGERMCSIAAIHGIRTTCKHYAEDSVPDLAEVRELFLHDKSITHLAVVHCETTTGILNPVEEAGNLCREFGKIMIVDAMSSFGAIPLNVKDTGIHFLISSSNKCLEGIPGFSFVLAGANELRKTQGYARTLTLDLFDQWQGLENNGQFRFTPPVQSILSFRKALEELKNEGGVQARARRYKNNYDILLKGMQAMGFAPYLKEDHRGYIITSFLYPEHPEYNFGKFYALLSGRGFVIYSGKLTQIECFRIGTIGKIGPEHIVNLLSAIKEVLVEMNCFPLR
jgi:2-aminoethylphosphonate-pyruvate transaminase